MTPGQLARRFVRYVARQVMLWIVVTVVIAFLMNGLYENILSLEEDAPFLELWGMGGLLLGLMTFVWVTSQIFSRIIAKRRKYSTLGWD